MQTIGPTSVGNIYFSPLGRPCELENLMVCLEYLAESPSTL